MYSYTGSKKDAILFLKKSFASYSITNNIKESILENFDTDILLFKTYKDFKIYLENSKKTFKNISPQFYNNIYEEFPLDVEEILKNNKICRDAFNFLKAKTKAQKIELIIKNKNNHCNIFEKHKKNNYTDPSNFRWLFNHSDTYKLIDRIINHHIIYYSKGDIVDKIIFKTILSRNSNASCLETAIQNTTTIENVVLLDIKTAFDTPKHNIELYNIIYNELKKIMDDNRASNLTSLYFLLINNRKCYYKGNEIKINKGIPQGLGSSTLMFTLIFKFLINTWLLSLDEIIYTFILNIFVDDIFFKFLIKDTKYIINILSKLEKIFKKYNFEINFNKSFADENLEIQNIVPNILTEKNLYLGIPFTRDIQKYGSIILENFIEKRKINCNINWHTIRNFINTNNAQYNKKSIIGFLLYKLKPLIEGDITQEKVITFIDTHYIQNSCLEYVHTMQSIIYLDYYYYLLFLLFIISLSIVKIIIPGAIINDIISIIIIIFGVVKIIISFI